MTPESYPEWLARLAANRRARINAEANPIRRSQLEATDAACRTVDRAMIRLVTGTELNN